MNKPKADTVDGTLFVVAEAVAFDDDLPELGTRVTHKGTRPLLLFHGETPRINENALETLHLCEREYRNVCARVLPNED